MSLSPLAGQFSPLGRAVGAVAAFVPTDISGLTLWLKSDAGLFQDAAMTTPATADTDPIGGWQDQSGQAHHVTQSTAGRRPTLQNGAGDTWNGRGALLFDGTDDCLLTGVYTLNQPITVFMVVNQVTFAANDTLLAGVTDGTTRIRQLNDANSKQGIGLAYSTNACINPGLALGEWGVLRAVINGASSQVTISNGTPIAGDTGVVGQTGLCVGARPTGSAATNMRLLEVLVWAGTLSAEQTANVEGYLNGRHQIYNRGVTYYVDQTGGSDSAAGTSEAAAWKTLAKVNATPTIQPGDTVLFKRDETWNETLTVPSSGTSSYPITYGAYGAGAKPVFNGQLTRNTVVNGNNKTHLVFNDLRLINGLLSNWDTDFGTHIFNRVEAAGAGDQNFQNQGTTIVTYNDCSSTNAVDDGISMHGNAQVTLNNCTITGNTQGLNTSVTGGGTARLRVNNCTFTGNVTDNLTVDVNLTDIVVFGSYFGHPTGSDRVLQMVGATNYCVFDVSGAASATTTMLQGSNPGVWNVNNCTFYGGAAQNGRILAGAGVTINMKNCLVYSANIIVVAAAGAVNADHCLFNTITTKGNFTTNTNEVTAAPLLVDPANGDFHLQAGSPARNAGVAVVGLTEDYDGVSVPQEANPAIGAYEYVP